MSLSWIKLVACASALCEPSRLLYTSPVVEEGHAIAGSIMRG